VVSTFNRSDRQVAWSLRNRWNNVILKARQMNVIITHIYREGNQVADSLANHGLSLTSIVFWDDVLLFVSDSFINNKQGIPSLMFVWLRWGFGLVPPHFVFALFIFSINFQGG
jgi:hypothetical protein